ncbi:MAG: AraC family transcriptional regulator [Ruminococcaceae bacterium]|nr:AraC family transcriptional regulator [Oscillospiraceae bacterium]
MYSVNGDFGEVRLISGQSFQQSNGLFSLSVAGWHKCNDLYKISRPNGNTAHLLIITVGGCGLMEINGKEYSLPSGSVALIPRGIPNRYQTPSNGLWEFYWIHPSGSISEQFLDSIAQKGIYTGTASPDHAYRALMEDLISVCTRRTPQAAIQISQKLGYIFHFAAIDLQGNNAVETVTERAIAYIEKNFSKSILLEDIASHLFISTTHLIRVFKKEVGCTPHKYLINYRLLIGADLLKFSQLSIDEISSRVGFSSPSQFISCFKQARGSTPNEFRLKFSRNSGTDQQ